MPFDKSRLPLPPPADDERTAARPVGQGTRPPMGTPPTGVAVAGGSATPGDPRFAKGSSADVYRGRRAGIEREVDRPKGGTPKMQQPETLPWQRLPKFDPQHSELEVPIDTKAGTGYWDPASSRKTVDVGARPGQPGQSAWDPVDSLKTDPGRRRESVSPWQALSEYYGFAGRLDYSGVRGGLERPEYARDMVYLYDEPTSYGKGADRDRGDTGGKDASARPPTPKSTSRNDEAIGVPFAPGKAYDSQRGQTIPGAGGQKNPFAVKPDDDELERAGKKPGAWDELERRESAEHDFECLVVRALGRDMGYPTPGDDDHPVSDPGRMPDEEEDDEEGDGE